jgi:DNA primase
MIKIPQTTIVAFLNDNFTVKETSTGEIRINSPFLQDDKFHLYINPEEGVFKDFKSDISGSFSYFISEYMGIPEKDILPYLMKEYGFGNKTTYTKIIEERKEAELELPKGLHFFADTKLGYIGNLALDYLKERMIDEKYINEMGYVYDANSEYNNRIFIPFFEEGKLVYYICRDFTGTSYLRYANPHNINSKNFVYNIDNLQDTLFICEGVFDAISIKNIIGTAILSANLGETQAKKIMERAPSKIIIVPDNDSTGNKTLDDNVKMLIKYMPPSFTTQFFIYRIEGAKDLNSRLTDLGKSDIDINDCIPYQESKKMLLKSAKKATMEV